MYIVICCCEREIGMEGKSDTLDGARNVMRKAFWEVCGNLGITEDDIDGYEYALLDNTAWLNDAGLAHANYDWAILEV